MHQPVPSHSSSADTQQRLLQAAGEVFAEQGYRRATIREICRRAQANVAAVHYHFGDKERLYTAALRHAHRYAMEHYPPHLGLSHHAPAAQRLHAFVHSLLLRILDQGYPAWHGKLIAQAMIGPHHALDVLVEEEIRPLANQLEAIVQDLLDACADRDHVRLCALSIVGQCLFYHHAQAVIDRLYPEQRYSTRDIAQLADHIAQFSLGALQQLSQGARGDGG
jgi:AcrR family transcriptional regulator